MLGSNEYRFAFQGQEEDDEFWGGAVSYKYRVEDKRLGRFFSVDPLAASYPYNSPYAFSENVVISHVELEGLEKGRPATDKGLIPKQGLQTARATTANTYIAQIEHIHNNPVSQIDLSRKAAFALVEKGMDFIDAERRRQMYFEQGDPPGPYTSEELSRMEEFYDFVIPIKMTKKLLNGEEVSWKDIGVEALGLFPPFKAGSKVGKEIFQGVMTYTDEAVEMAQAGLKIDPNRLTHIFGKTEHSLGDLVKKFGNENEAFNAVQNAANDALKNGKLTPGNNGILPSGDLGNIIDVGGMNVRLIGGKIEDGKVVISSFSRKDL